MDFSPRPSQARGNTMQRGAYRGRDFHAKPWHFVAQPQEEIKPCGHEITKIKVNEIQPDEGAVGKPKITNSEYLASYNWLKQGSAILTPGAPPRWAPPHQATTLKQDSGDYFRDRNASSWPRFPLEPVARALFHCKADFEPATHKIVGCGNTLGNLLLFAASKERSFHIRAELVGKTLFLVRQEKSPTALIEGVYGYGHTFPEAYTTWDQDTQGSTSHQRIISYDLDGLKLLVRSEADGYLPEKVKDLAPVEQKTPDSHKTVKGDTANIKADVDSLVTSFHGTTVTQPSTVASSILTVQTSDNSIPQEAVFDLKTRSAKTEYNMDDILPRLWINCTPNFVLAYHERGLFNNVQVKDVRNDITNWEQSNARMVRMFHTLLMKLVDFARGESNGRFAVWRVKSGPLELRRIEDKQWSALPVEMKAKWAGVDVESLADTHDLDGKDSNTDDEEAEDDEEYLRF